MMRPFKHSIGSTLVGATALLLAACGGGGSGSSTSGGGGGGSAVTGLEMPTKLSVVTAAASASGAPAVGGIVLNYKAIAHAMYANLGDVQGDTDYSNDLAKVWVHDDSMGPLQTVNMILCLMDQTRASDMVNKGSYVALINENKCDEGNNGSGASSGGAQSSASGSTEQTTYNRWVIDSTRADENSHQYVDIWIPGKPGGDPQHIEDSQRILVHVDMAAGVSADKPFGEFTLSFKGVVDAADLPGSPVTTHDTNFVTISQGTLMTVAGNPLQFQFYNASGTELGGAMAQAPFSRVESTNVILVDAAGTTGEAVTHTYEWNDHNGNMSQDSNEIRRADYKVAFDSNYFVRQETNTTDEVCTARQQFNTNTWRYNLYHTVASNNWNGTGRHVAAGDLVKLNSGFPFSYQLSGQTHYGHVGYWGVWTEDNTALSSLDGKTITKETYGAGGTAQSYTLKVSSGVLHRRQVQALTLDRLVGVGLNWYGDKDDPFCMSGCPNQTDYRVTVVDNGNGTYSPEVTGSIVYGNNGPVVTDLDSPVVLAFANYWNQLWMYSDMLGGSVVMKTDPADTNLIKVVFYKEDTLTPADMSLAEGDSKTLNCYENCPKGGYVMSDTSSEADLFNVQWMPDPSHPVVYTYKLKVQNGAFVLQDDANGDSSVAFDTAAVNWANTSLPEWYQWGVQSGEMVDNSTLSGMSNPWDMYDETKVQTTYRWESGSNQWNQQVYVLDSTGAAVSFDKPLHLTLAFQAGDDPNYPSSGAQPFPNNTTFMLEYGGPGELQGFQWNPAPGCDPSTTECRWYPNLNLADGVELMDDGQGTYVVRAMESEQNMTQVAMAQCTNAGLDVSGVALDLPDSSVLSDVSITWPPELPSDPSPQVIEGELQ